MYMDDLPTAEDLDGKNHGGQLGVAVIAVLCDIGRRHVYYPFHNRVTIMVPGNRDRDVSDDKIFSNSSRAFNYSTQHSDKA
jgi:hypothetical protein